jgi:hypothetical protein
VKPSQYFRAAASLFPALNEHWKPCFEAHRDPVTFVHVGCDLHRSTIFVLHRLVDRFIARSGAEKSETDPAQIAEQIATALREAGYECVIAPPTRPI